MSHCSSLVPVRCNSTWDRRVRVDRTGAVAHRSMAVYLLALYPTGKNRTTMPAQSGTIISTQPIAEPSNL